MLWQRLLDTFKFSYPYLPIQSCDRKSCRVRHRHVCIQGLSKWESNGDYFGWKNQHNHHFYFVEKIQHSLTSNLHRKLSQEYPLRDQQILIFIYNIYYILKFIIYLQFAKKNFRSIIRHIPIISYWLLPAKN